MAITFDTLGYAQRLVKGGVDSKQAQAHAEAAKDFIMPELVTKSDLAAALELQTLRLTVRTGAFFFATTVTTVGLLAGLAKLFMT